MLSRQEVNTMRHLANAQYWDRPAGGNTGRLFLAFGGPVCADRFSNCPLDRVLTYKNLIYLLNLQFICPFHVSWQLSRMINCKIHADLCVRLFLRAITSEVPPPKVWKFQHLITIFSFTIEGIFLFILHICTRPLVDSLVWVSDLDPS